jgi:hypothetical protein
VSLGFKVAVSVLVLALSTGALVYAWFPLLVTHVPFAQSANIPTEYAEIVEAYLSAQLGSYRQALSIATLLVLVNLLVSFLVIWSPKRGASQNT